VIEIKPIFHKPQCVIITIVPGTTKKKTKKKTLGTPALNTAQTLPKPEDGANTHPLGTETELQQVKDRNSHSSRPELEADHRNSAAV
jgi:hypothetical protein